MDSSTISFLEKNGSWYDYEIPCVFFYSAHRSLRGCVYSFLQVPVRLWLAKKIHSVIARIAFNMDILVASIGKTQVNK